LTAFIITKVVQRKLAEVARARRHPRGIGSPRA
jgi:hypothetical protein